ncbi:helix-turn-helix domain-containing protein [Streptomyces sp. NPDC005017]|uniref:helix-turn-helix domain-containing protein n=1 Tax=Streptomyces sp. NPDC005017 TaxID=3364706 RepID=UPI0036B3410E
MTGATNEQQRQAPPGPHDDSVYRWDIHHVSASRHQHGPCGTCVSEDSARACIEAALSAAADGDGYAWGLLSRVPAATAERPHRTPLAWAAAGPDGRISWLPHGSRPYGDVDPMPPQRNESVWTLLERYGGELNRHRLNAGRTQAELALGTGWPKATVACVERARCMPSYDFTRQADRFLGADGALVRLWPSLIRPAYPDWFWHVIELERQAAFIQEFESVAVPGLLQTPAYARAISTAAHPVAPELEIQQLVAARVDRQRILARREPPHIVVTLDEAVLKRSIGGSRVMSEQLAHLLDIGARPRVHLQVIPFKVREHPGGMTPFRLMGFRDGPDVLYGETFTGGQTTVDAAPVQQHKLAFSLIQSKALSPDDSRLLIRSVKEELDRARD